MIYKKLSIILLIIILMLVSSCNTKKQLDTDTDVDSNSEENVADFLEKKPEAISEDFSDEYIMKEFPAAELKIGKPEGICIYNDTLVVCDKENSCLVLLDMECSYLRTIGSLGMGPVEFTEPTGITVYEGKLYILDNGNRRIQILDSDYNYVDEIPLDILVWENQSSEYIDLAIDDNGIMYVSTYAFINLDGYVFRIEDKKSEKLDTQFIGHVCSYNGSVYALNIQELLYANKTYFPFSGINSLYHIDDKKMEKIKDLPYKYTPAGISIYNDKVYTVSGYWKRIDIFSLEGELEKPVIKLPEDTTEMITNSSMDYFLTVLDESHIYCTDMNRRSVYYITKK